MVLYETLTFFRLRMPWRGRDLRTTLPVGHPRTANAPQCQPSPSEDRSQVALPYYNKFTVIAWKDTPGKIERSP